MPRGTRPRPGSTFAVRRGSNSLRGHHTGRLRTERVTFAEKLLTVCARWAVPPAPFERILALQASDPAASTTVRDPFEAVDRHVADSLVALELPFMRASSTVADIGSGAGWPGLALAVAL